MPPEKSEVRRWMVKAAHDRSTVEKILTPDCVETDVAAFHCQQTIEKVLKAFLVSHSVDFEKVHDLGRLLDQCVSVDSSFEALRDDVEPLTLYAVAFRYPGPAEPTVDDVVAAARVATLVWDFVASRLDDDCVP